MATKEYTFTLSKKAKAKGGDAYKCNTNESFVVYLPQELSRVGSNVHQQMKIKITPIVVKPWDEEDDDSNDDE